MRYNTNQVARGIINYIDSEVMPKLPTSSKWVLGTSVALMGNRIETIADELSEHPLIKMTGIVCDDGIDTDKLLEAMAEQADKYGNISMDIPFVGKLSFSGNDVSNLKRYIG